MRHIRLFLFGLSTALLISSCSQDEGDLSPDSPIIGNWQLDMIVYNDFPDGFRSNDGTIISLADLDIESWRYIFMPDGTYSSLYEAQGDGLSTNGEFDFAKDNVSFLVGGDVETSDLLTIQSGTIIDESTLAVYANVEVLALPNTILDTLATEISAEDFERFASPVRAKIYYFFDRAGLESL